MNYLSYSGKAARAIRSILAERRESIESLAEGTNISLSTLKRRLGGLSAFTIDELGVISDHFGLGLAAVLTPVTERRDAA